MAEFDALLFRAHTLGLRVLLDIVANRCSSEHPLFQAALAAGPGSPEREMFQFVPDGGESAAEQLAERLRRAGVESSRAGVCY